MNLYGIAANARLPNSYTSSMSKGSNSVNIMVFYIPINSGYRAHKKGAAYG